VLDEYNTSPHESSYAMLFHMKSPENQPIDERIRRFESVKEEITPEILKEMMNGHSNEQFWAEECLEDSFERDVTFGAKIWSGFSEILETAKIKFSEEAEDVALVKEFNFLSELAMRADLPIDNKLKATAVLKIRENFVKHGFNRDSLSGSNIMKLAFIGEAEAMELYRMDWREKRPFSFSLELNRENPEVKAILEEVAKKQHLADSVIQGDPDLEKLFKDFYQDKKPPIQ